MLMELLQLQMCCAASPPCRCSLLCPLSSPPCHCLPLHPLPPCQPGHAHDHQCQWGPVLLASRMLSGVLRLAHLAVCLAAAGTAHPHTVLLRFMPTIDVHAATCAQLFMLLCQLVKQQRQPVAPSSQCSCMCCPHVERADSRCCCSCCACRTGRTAA